MFNSAIHSKNTRNAMTSLRGAHSLATIANMHLAFDCHRCRTNSTKCPPSTRWRRPSSMNSTSDSCRSTRRSGRSRPSMTWPTVPARRLNATSSVSSGPSATSRAGGASGGLASTFASRWRGSRRRRWRRWRRRRRRRERNESSQWKAKYRPPNAITDQTQYWYHLFWAREIYDDYSTVRLEFCVPILQLKYT